MATFSCGSLICNMLQFNRQNPRSIAVLVHHIYTVADLFKQHLDVVQTGL